MQKNKEYSESARYYAQEALGLEAFNLENKKDAQYSMVEYFEKFVKNKGKNGGELNFADMYADLNKKIRDYHDCLKKFKAVTYSSYNCHFGFAFLASELREQKAKYDDLIKPIYHIASIRRDIMGNEEAENFLNNFEALCDDLQESKSLLPLARKQMSVSIRETDHLLGNTKLLSSLAHAKHYAQVMKDEELLEDIKNRQAELGIDDEFYNNFLKAYDIAQICKDNKLLYEVCTKERTFDDINKGVFLRARRGIFKNLNTRKIFRDDLNSDVSMMIECYKKFTANEQPFFEKQINTYGYDIRKNARREQAQEQTL